MRLNPDKFKELKGRMLFKAAMKRYTTMRVGGIATALYEPQSTSDLVDFLKLALRNRTSIFVIGNGSNIIVSDKVIKRVAVRLASPHFKKVTMSGKCVICGAGLLLNNLCRFTETNSLSGCEFLIGIPGTVGGAIIQNAGAHNSTISDIVKHIRCVDQKGDIKILTPKEANFKYRGSGLKDMIIIEATLNLKKAKNVDIGKKISRYIEKRLISQDYSAPSAGCIFKNPQESDLTAAQLIDRCGLKGEKIGGASISRKHANFIINNKAATTEDILRLIALVKRRVKKKFDISLWEEVEIIR